MCDLFIFHDDVVAHYVFLSTQPLLLVQKFLLLLVMLQLDHLVGLPVLLDQTCAVLAAPAEVLGQPPILRFQAAALGLDLRHLSSHIVQVTLELALYLSGQAGAIAADLLQVFLLFFAGELEGDVPGEEGVDLLQEGPGDIRDAAQGLGKVFPALHSVGSHLLLECGFISPQADGFQVNVVPVSVNLIHLYLHHLGCLGEVGPHEFNHGFQLFSL